MKTNKRFSGLVSLMVLIIIVLPLQNASAAAPVFKVDSGVKYETYRVQGDRANDGVIYMPIIFSPPLPPPLAPMLNEIDNADGDGTYTVRWNAVDTADSYILEEDDNDAFSSTTTVYTGDSTSTSIANKGLGTYYYRVKAANPSGESDWSNAKSADVTTEPVCQSLVSGNWSGTGTGGLTLVELSVSSDGSQVTSFVMTWIPDVCRLIRLSSFDNRPITQCQFSDHADIRGGNVEWRGDFTSPTTATGTWNITTDTCNASGTWIANAP